MDERGQWKVCAALRAHIEPIHRVRHSQNPDDYRLGHWIMWVDRHDKARGRAVLVRETHVPWHVSSWSIQDSGQCNQPAANATLAWLLKANRHLSIFAIHGRLMTCPVCPPCRSGPVASMETTARRATDGAGAVEATRRRSRNLRHCAVIPSIVAFVLHRLIATSLD